MLFYPPVNLSSVGESVKPAAMQADGRQSCRDPKAGLAHPEMVSTAREIKCLVPGLFSVDMQSISNVFGEGEKTLKKKTCE